MREFVHEPMKTRSSAISSIGGSRLESHVGEGALGGLASSRVVEVIGRWHLARDLA